MKITSATPPITTGTGNARTRPAAPTARQPEAAVEQVALSSLASRLQQAGGAETTVVDAARVAEIKQAIAEGRFRINPERIADGLLASVRDMLAKRG